MNLSELDTSLPLEALVKETGRITPEGVEEVRHIVLSVLNPRFSYEEGQSIGVLVPGPHPFGNRQHLRLYSIASARREGERADLSICVRRCFYIDEVSGERYPGIASNYLCDARPGDRVTITGPYAGRFQMPASPHANLLMIGTGTGIAPFRAFIKHIFDERGGWRGKVRLFYGARVGMELLYMNDVRDDLASYYQEATFKAFAALSPRPAVQSEPELQRTLEDNAQEVWALIQDPKTHVYVAGQQKTAATLDRVFAGIAGSEALWRWRKQELAAQGRWAELFYD
jgi:ferredoxin--NADP+ reductase